MTGRWSIDWKEYTALIDQVAGRLAYLGEPHLAFRGVPRGGLIPAVMLSHQMSLGYEGPFHEGIRLHNPNTVVVDDILDTGLTLIEMVEPDNCPLVVAVIIAKPAGVKRFNEHLNNGFVKKPTLVIGHIYEGPDWVVFPYENPLQEGPDHEDF